MKQLKFMLAAATAIGLATAAQAATTPLDSENFDGDGYVGKTTAELTGFSYSGTDATEDESVVVAGGAGDTANALQVNTGTDPILKALKATDGNAVPQDLAGDGVRALNIDTMVQFTVTPDGEPVTATADDKLMIYLKEVAAVTDVDGNVTTPASTNLVVKALKYRAAYFDEDIGENQAGTSDKVDVGVTYENGDVPVIEVGTWYNLKVDTVLVDGVPMFTIKIDDRLIKPAYTLHLAVTGSSYFPSLLGTSSTTLTYVGFAGEGKVDTLVFTKDVVSSSVDFTLVATGASAVWTTIGDVKYELAGGKIALPAETTSFTLEYTATAADSLWNPVYAAKLTEAANCTVENLVVTLGEGAPSATLTVTATEGESAPVVGENDTATSVGITGGAFASATKAELQDVLNWAVANGQTKANVNDIPPFEDGTGNATNLVQEAYLLDCAVDADAVEAKKLQFTFPAIVPGTVPEINSEFTYNGTLTIKGKAALGDAEWGATEGAKFFKAFLTK